MTTPGLSAVKDDPENVHFERALARLMRESATVELAPQSGLADVMQRIERRETRRRFWTWPWRAGLGPAALRPLALAVGVQAIVIVMLTGVLWVGVGARPVASYRTLGSAATLPLADTAGASALVRLVLADGMTLGELRNALAPWGSRIVDGPTAAGIYTIAVGSGGDTDAMLTALRMIPGVLLAEEVTPP